MLQIWLDANINFPVRHAHPTTSIDQSLDVLICDQLYSVNLTVSAPFSWIQRTLKDINNTLVMQVSDDAHFTLQIPAVSPSMDSQQS